MALEDLFIEAMETAAVRTKKVQVITGTAKNVQEDVCDVYRDGLPTLYNVKLTSKDKTSQNYLKVTPKENAIVVVALVDGQKTEAVVIAQSEVEKIEINLANNQLTIDNQGVNMNLSTGKLTLKNTTEDLKALISDLIDACMAITIPLAPSGTAVPGNILQFQAVKERINLLFN